MTAGEQIVLVDMDGVLADFEEPNNDIVRANFPDIQVVTERSEFYFKETYRDYPEVVEKVEAECRLPGFIRSFPIVDGAIYGWQRILEAGYTPRLCTSPLENHDTIITEKKDWLEEYFVPRFGAWVIDTAIFNRDKSGYDAIAIIDDRPTLRNIEKAVWQHIVFSRSYNQAVQTEFRVEDWYDPALDSLLAKCKDTYKLKR